MTNGNKILIGILLSFVVLLLGAIVVGIGSYISAHNYGVTAEKELEAKYADMENVLAQYSIKVKEAVQIPSMKVEDLERVTREAMSGRYGDQGSKAVFQWIQENYPGQVTDELYAGIQRLIEAGRNKFEARQTGFIDSKRAYETSLGLFWRGLWLKIAGYPKIDLDALKLISSEHAQQTFETGVDRGLQLR
jgi:hypothetical protein